ncbi:metallophosphoesterase [Paenibacillus chibensis]|uniref:Metallophosphoesterase n=1 Tax=Paenibacillus chibensis TaxID=59846 RepID=A0ABU6PN96_9BACL|nr:metallophosphoesterase [Paenibacillus chibensis]
MLSIVHLTDIHLSITQQNSIFEKKKELISAIISELRNSNHSIIIISGDIANFGLIEEYEDLAFPFFSDIKDLIQNELKNIIVEFILIPGNHDCNFTNKETMEVRDALINTVISDNTYASNHAFINQIICQDDFKIIKDIFHEQWTHCKLIAQNEIFEKVELKIGEKRIIFNLFNSSWISTITEQPGKMYFPVNYISKLALSSIGDVNLSIIHHPTHWLTPNNKREVEELLHSLSDFILTGHEHVASKTLITDWENRSIKHIEGMAAQELGEPYLSGFNIIHFKLEDMSFCVKSFSWSSLYYKEIEEEARWRSLIDLPERSLDKNSIELNPAFKEFINDLALQVTHPRISNLHLSDIYVYPNIEEIIYDDDDMVHLKTDEVAEIIKKDKESYLFFTGEKDSGKTALSKMLFQYYYGEKYYPFLIEGMNLTQGYARNINLLIKSLAKNMYSDETMYIQLEKAKRVLIIDNWHKSPINTDLKMKFLKDAKNYFSRVIIFSESNNIVNDSIRMISKEKEYPFRHFEILSFGHVKRNEFIEKWVTLGQRDTLENSMLLREVDRINRAIKPIIMQSYVPRYPLYLLIIIKTVEAGKPHNFEKSSNAYYFEVLIKDSLSNLEIENSETDKLYQYLTDLAYELYHLKNSMTLEDWRIFHRKHLDYYDMSDDQLPFKELKNKLEREKIIKNGLSGYEYNYSYMYYFFVAQYIARKINDDNIKKLIMELCHKIHITDNANIIMFLTHLSKDEFIKEEVLNAAKKVFGNLPYLRLEEDVVLINELCEEISPLVLHDIDVREHRRSLDEKLDEHERSVVLDSKREVSAYTEEDDETNLVMERVNIIDQGFKMLDIIGQILKNYYGSLSGHDKYILCEELFKLGLRINYSFIGDLKDNNKPLVEYISSIIIERNLENNKERAEKMASKLLYSMGGLITFNSIAKIAFSVGTPDLDRTYIKVKDSLSCNSAELAYLFIKLEYYEIFPHNEVRKLYQSNKTNKLAVQILQQMVRRYLYMYETNRSERQRICDLVGLKIDHSKTLRKLN